MSGMEDCQVRHYMLTSPPVQASDNQPGQCVEITKCESVGRQTEYIYKDTKINI